MQRSESFYFAIQQIEEPGEVRGRPALSGKEKVWWGSQGSTLQTTSLMLLAISYMSDLFPSAELSLRQEHPISRAGQIFPLPEIWPFFCLFSFLN